MESKILPFKTQVEALRSKQYNKDAAEIVVDNLKYQVNLGTFTWAELGTTAGELDLLLLRTRLHSAE